MSLAHLPPLLQQALQASQDNDVAAAIELLEQARAEDPSSGLACFLLAANLAQVGRYTDAEVQYSNAVLLAPELIIARYELGTLQFTSGRASAAMLTWQPLLALPAEHYMRLFVLGYAALASDHFTEATTQFDRGIVANTENPPLNANIRLLLERIRDLPAGNVTPAPAAHEPQGAESETTEHFLLSGYGKSLH